MVCPTRSTEMLLILLLGSSALLGASAGGRVRVNSCLDPTNVDYNCEVEELMLENCDITDDDIDDLVTCLDESGREDIVSLYIGQNSLTTLPGELFADLTNLKVLSLSFNDLAILPEELFAGLTTLEVVSLRYNALTTLPEGLFADLTLLSWLSLQYNDLTTLPEGLFADLTNLETLFLDGNALTTLPEGLFADLTALDFLDLAANSLECLPTIPSTWSTLDVDAYGDECGCSITGVTDNVCGDEACTPGEFGYTCGGTFAPVPAPTEAPVPTTAAPSPAPTEAPVLVFSEAPVSTTPAPVPVPTSAPASTTPVPESALETTTAPSPEGSQAPVQDWMAQSCDYGSTCPGNLCCHPELKTCGRKYTFCQERDLFNGVRCCSGTDGDPSDLNVCAEDYICDAPEGQSTIERTEVWLSIVASALAIIAVIIGCRKIRPYGCCGSSYSTY